jgi:hypothetical protein
VKNRNFESAASTADALFALEPTASELAQDVVSLFYHGPQAFRQMFGER